MFPRESTLQVLRSSMLMEGRRQQQLIQLLARFRLQFFLALFFSAAVSWPCFKWVRLYWNFASRTRAGAEWAHEDVRECLEGECSIYLLGRSQGWVEAFGRARRFRWLRCDCAVRGAWLRRAHSRRTGRRHYHEPRTSLCANRSWKAAKELYCRYYVTSTAVKIRCQKSC